MQLSEQMKTPVHIHIPGKVICVNTDSMTTSVNKILIVYMHV